MRCARPALRKSTPALHPPPVAARRARPAGVHGNQAVLRQLMRQADDGPAPRASGGTGASASVDVWGLSVDASMCGCRGQVRDLIAWADKVAAAYASCATPANATAPEMDACARAKLPPVKVGGTTNSSGKIDVVTPPAGPCARLIVKQTAVHETMHSRHADDLARAQGEAFFKAWRALAGDPGRLEKLRGKFPKQVEAFEAQWTDGPDAARDEVRAYTWNRRFLQDALKALDRIC